MKKGCFWPHPAPQVFAQILPPAFNPGCPGAGGSCRGCRGCRLAVGPPCTTRVVWKWSDGLFAKHKRGKQFMRRPCSSAASESSASAAALLSQGKTTPQGGLWKMHKELDGGSHPHPWLSKASAVGATQPGTPPIAILRLPLLHYKHTGAQCLPCSSCPAVSALLDWHSPVQNAGSGSGLLLMWHLRHGITGPDASSSTDRGATAWVTCAG